MKTYKIYFVVGEPSGDLLAARLIKALNEMDNVKFKFYGIGGEAMRAQGFKSLFDNSLLARMGFFEVLPAVPKILRRIGQLIEDIKSVQPDIVVTVDSYSFAISVIKRIKQAKIDAPIVHYVAPQVWAWRGSRVKKLKGLIDHLLTILPGEPKLFEGYVPATFVGHPSIERCKIDKAQAQALRAKYGIGRGDKLLCVLPGSRTSEVKYLLPVLTRTVNQLAKTNKNLYVVVPSVTTVAGKVAGAIRRWKLPTIMVMGEEDRYNAFVASDVAVAASGTVSLELAVCKVPHIIIYKVNRATAYLARKVLKIKYVNLINILQKREIIPELLQEKCTPANIAAHIGILLNDDAARGTQIKQATAAMQLLRNRDDIMPSQKAAAVIMQVLKDSGAKK
ncbi:MAG: lipid-A-disaccharide synthase [Alphaproteobacteria bacterium]|nr:lipid-A-disaccharide synthase [Alphaproteobacteria bacterium]